MRKINFRWIFSIFVFFFLGLFMSRKILLGNAFYIISSVLIFTGLFFAFFYNILKNKNYESKVEIKSYIKKFCVLLFVFVFGVGYFVLGYYSFLGKDYGSESQVISGRVSDIKSTSVFLTDVKISGKNSKNVTLFLNAAYAYNIGDTLTFESQLKNIDLFELGKMRTYYYRNNIAYTCSASVYNIVYISNGMSMTENFKFSIKEKLSKQMKPESAEIAYAMIFGDRADVADESLDAFENAGIMHLLAVSGLHIGFLTTVLIFLLGLCKIRRWLAFIICAIILFAYCFLCNFTPSVVRASIMFLLMSLRQTIYKQYDGLNSLGLAGIIILILMPLSALDVGFVLSFCCVLSIFEFSKPIYRVFKRKFKKIKNWKVRVKVYTFWRMFAMSIAVQLGTLPVLMIVFGTFPILSIIVNMVAIPLMEVSYIMTILFLPITFLFPFLSFILRLPAYTIYGILSVAKFLATIEFLNFPLLIGNIITVLALLCCLFLFSKYINITKRAKAVITAIVFCAIFVINSFAFVPIKTTSVTFIGKHIVVQDGNSATVVLGGKDLGSLDTYFKDKANVKTTLVIGNDLEILEKFSCKKILIDISTVVNNSKVNFMDNGNEIVAMNLEVNEINFLLPLTDLSYADGQIILTNSFSKDVIIGSQNYLDNEYRIVIDKASLKSNTFLQKTCYNWTINFKNGNIKNIRGLD